MDDLIYEQFKDKRYGEEALANIRVAHGIILDYMRQGYTLTLRQLYYQFVSRNIIPNTERSYKNLGTLITDARMTGDIPWNGIEDRAREVHQKYSNEDMRSVFRGIEYHFAVNPWERQEHYIEVWVEKEALGNVVERPCADLHVTHMACKGYLSASQAWAAGKRFKYAFEEGKRCILIHLGDHDPSGLDMTRDNGERVNLFSDSYAKVERIALNMDQISRYRPPPNPAKITDSRASDYIKRCGNESWELDALEPSVIDRLIRDKINQYRDVDLWNEDMAREEEAREHLKKFYSHYDKIEGFVRDL